MTIKINNTSFDSENSFHIALNEAIINRFLIRYGIVAMNNKSIPRSRLIVEFNKTKIELKLIPNSYQQYNILQYKTINKKVIGDFQQRISYLLQNRSLEGFVSTNNIYKSEEFNTEKIFNTIDYYSKEIQKNSTPIIYTGMTD